MIHWIAAALLVVGFVVLVRMFGLVEKSKNVVATSRRSLAVIRSSSLSDNEKEAALQKNAKRLFALFFILTFGGAAAVLLPAAVLWLCDWLGWISFEAVLRITISPAFLITSGILVVLAMGLGSRKAADTNKYSATERTLHRIAFKTTTAQIGVADLEDRMFAKRLAPCKTDRPVFITALPRAGTTLLLECCADLRDFASHCYRDMPFVLVPCLWNQFSASFRKNAKSQQRAHGDGMLINFDSPEALEEMVWRMFWQRQYRNDRIIPWQNETNPEFEDFFRSHMAKIIFLRRGNEEPAARYVSKNNLNIARIPLLRRLFPDSVILVPFRHPLHHAASLLEQHRNFLRIHKEDRFARQYMRAIGHYDFGQNLRPIDFDDWFDQRQSTDPQTLAFWLEYWVAGYKHLLIEDRDALHLLNYEALCNDPQHGLKRMADVIDTRDADSLIALAGTIRAPRPRDVDTADVPATLMQEVHRVYTDLKNADRDRGQ